MINDELDIKIDETWLKVKLNSIMLKKILGRDKNSIIINLNDLKIIENFGIEIETIKGIAVKNAIQYIEEKNDILNLSEIPILASKQDEGEEVREILLAIKELKLSDSELNENINHLSNYFKLFTLSKRNNNYLLSADQILKHSKPFYRGENTISDLNVTVCRGILNGNTDVAIKTYTHSDMDFLAKFHNEREILEKINGNSSFPVYYGYYTEELSDNNSATHSLSFVMELCHCNLLKDILNKKKSYDPYSPYEYRKFVIDLLEGFAFLEYISIAHQDIKPHNILLTSDRKLKIADFSVSEIHEKRFPIISTTDEYLIKGTDGYMAPELQIEYDKIAKGAKSNQKIKYSPEKADVFSLGLVFLEMYSLENVKGFNQENGFEQLLEKLNQIGDNWIGRMLKEMLRWDNNERPNFLTLHSKYNQDSTFCQT